MKSNDNYYIHEAFNRLKCLDEEVFDLSVDAGKLDELREFVADDIEAPAEEYIIDTEAEDKHDLQDSYVGKVILECSCCHSRIYKDEDGVEIDAETGMANINEECPVCGGLFGYNVIGKIEKFDDEVDFEDKAEEPEADLEEPEDEISDEEIGEALKEALKEENCEGCEEKEEVEEGCNKEEALNEEAEEKKKCARCDREEGEDVVLDQDGLCDLCHDELYKESLEKVDMASEDSKKLDEECDEEKEESLEKVEAASEDSKKLDESINEVEVKTEDGEVEVEKEGNKVTVEFKEEGDTEAAGEVGEEEIVPLSDEEISSIENNDIAPEEDILGEEPIEGEEPLEDEEAIDDFDEEGFEEMGESYLTRVYDNVKSYKVNEVKEGENKGLVVEGLITFESGKESKTTFVFENSKVTKRGKTLFEGHNDMFSKSNKAFMLKGLLENKKFVCESLTYNYNASNINESNESESIKVYGRVVR